jgi:high-affinity iron transporter
MRSAILGFLFLILIPFSHTYADARLIIHLTDYLANDYGGAVGENQKVLSETEYAEQKEFGQKVLEEGAQNLKLKDQLELQKSLRDLNDHILKKSSASVVVPLARKIQKEVLLLSGIALSPSQWPDYKKAEKIYAQSCAQCHGDKGFGDGPLGKDLDPKPANFHDLSRAPIVSPFAAFNTIRLGVPGTGMAAFDFSDDDVWSLAFYVSTFRFGTPHKTKGELSQEVSNDEVLAQLASSTDEQFKSYALLIHEDPISFLSKARLNDAESESVDYLARAKSLLGNSVRAFKDGKYVEAQNSALEAYFQGFDLVESKISANDPAAVTRIEEKMAGFRKAVKDQNAEGIHSYYQALVIEIDDLQKLFADKKITPSVAFLSGFSIILREGFEAVLVILAILGVAKAAGTPSVTMAIHSGWIISLILGIIGWYISGVLISMSGVSRELMEAIAAFFAVFVLIYVGFWMHRQTEISRWKEFINVKVKNLTQTKNLLGLFALAFLVTFREVIETVLFLRTVYIDTEVSSQAYIFFGVLVAFAIVLIVSVMITKYRNKIPLHKFFNLSSVLMMILATILTGKGMHAFQESGLVVMSPTPFKLRIELLGIFPSWQTIISQVVIFGLSLFIWKNAGKKK